VELEEVKLQVVKLKLGSEEVELEFDELQLEFEVLQLEFEEVQSRFEKLKLELLLLKLKMGFHNTGPNNQRDDAGVDLNDTSRSGLQSDARVDWRPTPISAVGCE
jgi:hypothetical protein